MGGVFFLSACMSRVFFLAWELLVCLNWFRGLVMLWAVWEKLESFSAFKVIINGFRESF